MKLELTPSGIGSAVHELMRDGLTSLPQAVDRVTSECRQDALLESDLVPWMVRMAEQIEFQNNRPLAFGNGAGQDETEAHADIARPARSLLKGNPNDFLVVVPGDGRKRAGDCTRQDVRKMYQYCGSYRQTYAAKERAFKSVWQAMIDQNVERVEDLPNEWARKLLGDGTA